MHRSSSPAERAGQAPRAAGRLPERKFPAACVFLFSAALGLFKNREHVGFFPSERLSKEKARSPYRMPGIFDAESCRCGEKTMFIIFQISLGEQREQYLFEHFRFHRTLQGIPFCAKIQVFSGDGLLRGERPRTARRSRRRRAPLFRPLHRAYYSPPYGGRNCQVGRRK